MLARPAPGESLNKGGLGAFFLFLSLTEAASTGARQGPAPITLALRFPP